jgi:hypothetical protein
MEVVMRRATLLLLPLFLLACDPAPVAPPLDMSPSFNYMNNPDNGNPQIWRNEWDAAYRWLDGSLRVTVTTFPIGGQGTCGTDDYLDTWEWQDLVFGDDWTDPLTRLIETGQQNAVWIVVDDVSTAGGCFVTTTYPGGGTLLAEGIGKARNNDNDLWGIANGTPETDDDDPWTNAWGFRATGQLSDPDGNPISVSGHLHCTYSSGDAAGRCQTQIILR